MKLLLISETPIIEHIFTLICKKLEIELFIKNTNEVDSNFDIIIIDDMFIDDKFNIIKQYSKRLGAISKEELSFDKSRDFLIPRPFLPTKLQTILIEQIDIIKIEIQNEVPETNSFNTLDEEEDDECTVPILDFVDSLAEDVYLDIEDENDESIVNLASLEDGGILDSSELTKINDLLYQETIMDDMSINDSDWKDISEIIDDALDEVKDYEFSLDKPKNKVTQLFLNKYALEEIKPLLEKLDQNIISSLSAGNSIDIKISLKDEN